MKRREVARRERPDLARFMRGLALSGLPHIDEFASHLREVGFGDIRTDKRSAIMPSALIIRNRRDATRLIDLNQHG